MIIAFWVQKKFNHDFMNKFLFTFFLFIVSAVAFSQQQTLKGIVVNDKGEAVEFATVALMNPRDTTLENFGFSNAAGNFEVKNVSASTYLLQISFVGYITYDTIISIPLLNPDMGIFVLQTAIKALDAVNISGERTPLQIKGDTIEYNAAAFKTSPDASAEDLLKKLPGVEVDGSGNIKAQGEEVQQVLVDGKEFFSNDPAVATKNLPADAIDKVQVYDRSSEESEFTGVDDGQRNKTINLLLKEGKKSMWLGSAEAGGGTNDRYEVNAKVYRFTKENQLAGLGMLNNINHFGFSINDYIDFNGGIGALMSSGGFRLETGDSESMPLNFGQQVNGLINSGAAGFNFTHESVPGNRFNISYLGNGYHKYLLQESYTENFTSGFDFITNDSTDENTKNYYHRLNFTLRNKPDSLQNLIATGGLSLNYGNKTGKYFTENYTSDSLTNSLNSETYDNSHNITGNIDLNYVYKTNGNWRYLKSTGNINAKTALSENQWNNRTEFFDSGTEITDQAFQNNTNQLLNYTFSFAALYKLKEHHYLEPSVAAGAENEIYNRRQGALADEDLPVDSLSPEFLRNALWIRPGIAFKYAVKNTQLKIKADVEDLMLSNKLNEVENRGKNYVYLLPQVSIEHEIKQGRHIRFMYESDATAPSAIQLLPVKDYMDPLSVYQGNLNLRPEYRHSFYFNYMLFDQFSFTSLFTHLNFTYTKDKINYAKTIYEDLSQVLSLVNTSSDYTGSAGFDFSTPIRPLKLNLRFSFDEQYDRGINYINDEENTIDAFTHSASLSFDNRKKDKIDMRIGASIDYTVAEYSIATTENKRYITNAGFLEFDYSPSEAWRFSCNADINRYSILGFDNETIVPLLQAEINRYILKSNRGTLSLKGYDLLNKNSGVQQTGAYNYLRTTTSNTIGRYFLLSFKYRINKADQQSGVQVEINGK